MASKLAEMKLLAGQEETITIMDFRKGPGDVIAQVQQGKTFHITKNGVVVAVIASPEPSALQLGAQIRRMKLA